MTVKGSFSMSMSIFSYFERVSRSGKWIKMLSSLRSRCMTFLSYSAPPTDLQIFVRSICGRLVWGEKQPAFTNSEALNLSMLPTRRTIPSGSIKKDTDGKFSWLSKQSGGAHSMTPPTLQYSAMYCSHPPEYSVGCEILTFLGSIL